MKTHTLKKAILSSFIFSAILVTCITNSNISSETTAQALAGNDSSNVTVSIVNTSSIAASSDISNESKYTPIRDEFENTSSEQDTTSTTTSTTNDTDRIVLDPNAPLTGKGAVPKTVKKEGVENDEVKDEAKSVDFEYDSYYTIVDGKEKLVKP